MRWTVYAFNEIEAKGFTTGGHCTYLDAWSKIILGWHCVVQFMAVEAWIYVYNVRMFSVGKQNFSNTRRQMSGEASEAKKSRVTMKIGTHNGTFHCDEVLACFLLKLLPEYADAEIIRYTVTT